MGAINPIGAPQNPHPKANCDIYVDQRCDNLFKIAQKVFGDGNQYTRLHRLNADKIGSNPDNISVGMRLKLTEKPGADRPNQKPIVCDVSHVKPPAKPPVPVKPVLPPPTNTKPPVTEPAKPPVSEPAKPPVSEEPAKPCPKPPMSREEAKEIIWKKWNQRSSQAQNGFGNAVAGTAKTVVGGVGTVLAVPYTVVKGFVNWPLSIIAPGKTIDPTTELRRAARFTAESSAQAKTGTVNFGEGSIKSALNMLEFGYRSIGKDEPGY